MTASYFVKRAEWGLHVRLQGALAREQRDGIVRRIEDHCAEFAVGNEPWSSLIEFDHFEADDFRPEMVVALMRLARRCGHQRSAVVMTDWHWASAMADAMITAGTDDQVRIFVQAVRRADGGHGREDLSGLDGAMAWVLHGGAVPMVSKAA
ncbi:hypothetical protein [Azospirillum picis]|uniref:Uncharacterized protein n=1 Tax=Azospirillum picis TaxID=488438 RepID=A0ABU0ML28_9PROT|nr:hypothetical protein [Azospirillum picis]MBP2300326.1 hypothetical protein [Azospirillum picis]MDQ0534122.1 hypothetical protein [Azospirillum picis]